MIILEIKFTSNLNEVANKLQNAADRIPDKVSFDTLFNKAFMNKYTNFDSLEDLLTYCGYEVNSKEDFEAIPEDEFNKKISSCTKFNSWNEMYTTAGQEYIFSNFKL